MTRAIAVTATDTGVGKTTVSCAIAAAAAERGMRVRVLKPIETGIADPHGDCDAERLRKAARSTQKIGQASVWSFRAPASPLFAARQAGMAVDIGTLDAAFETLCRDADLVVVEGAGGLMVPITPTESFATLFGRWGLPVLIVAPDRLGVVNHVRLTCQAACTEKLPITAIVLHDVAPARRDATSAANGEVIRELLPSVPLMHFPWVADDQDFSSLAAVARESGLLARCLDEAAHPA
jgi:dethiobiotin synthetase